jgi:hypothetical protein
MTHLPIRRLPAVTLAVAVAALCLAACGSSSTGSSSAAASASSSSSSSGSGSGSGFNRTKIASCLKAHGVTLPTRPAGAGRRRPGSGGGGGFFGGGEGGGAAGGGAPGGRFANPKFQAALKACGGANFTGRRRFTFSHANIEKFIACVKQHGYNLPAPNYSGKGGIFPTSIEKSAKFQAASKACASDLRPSGAPPGGGAGGGAPPPSA